MGAVDHDVTSARLQRTALEADMARTGQTGALVVAELAAATTSAGHGFTRTTWAQGPISVLPQADVVDLFLLPVAVDGQPRTLSVRWDVAERVCASCWQAVPDLEPRRVITRRWPSPAELEVLDALDLGEQPPPGG